MSISCVVGHDRTAMASEGAASCPHITHVSRIRQKPRFGPAAAKFRGLLLCSWAGSYVLRGPMYRKFLYPILSIAALPFLLVSSASAETGLASYYSAPGNGMTCAHRTRPFGSIVRVSYGDRSIQCRVNDRGPFGRGRVIDLSLNAARALGMMRSGVIRVSLD